MGDTVLSSEERHFLKSGHPSLQVWELVLTSKDRVKQSGDYSEAAAELARSLGIGSAKLCEGLGAFYGKGDARSKSAAGIDLQLQPLIAALAKLCIAPLPKPA